MANAFEVEVIRSRLDASVGELTQLLYRSAYSTLMRESRDCSFLYMTPEGNVMVNGVTLAHQSTYYYFIRSLLERFPDMREGDLYMTNHPYLSGIPHTPDLTVAAPSFVDGVLVGFSCSIAHKSDFGGSVVGSASMGATHLFQEGLLLPPVLAARDGVANPAVEKIIAANVRDPDLFFGDMRAQIGVTHLGVERLAALAQQVGVTTLLEAYGELLNQGERSLRNHLRVWPDGTSRAEAFMDSDGTPDGPPVKLVVAVTVEDDRISFDLSESDDQAAGPVNLTPCYTDTGIFFALVSLTNPEFGYNDGMRRAVAVTRRPGSVLDPAFPAPVGAAQSVKQRFNDLCFEALCHFVPERAIAHSGGSGGTLGISWRAASSDGARSLQYEVFGSGMGAMTGRDGVSGVGVYTSNLAMTPIEILESMYPVRIRRFELATDSGGPGTWRGGLSYRREYEALEPAGVRRRGERAHFPGKGVRGGWPGDVAHVWIERHDGTVEQAPVAGSYELERGDRMRIQGAGAGGFGDPFARDVAAVLADIEAGYVSPNAARHSYGVVVNSDGTIDTQATAELRTRHGASQPPDGVTAVDVAGTGVGNDE